MCLSVVIYGNTINKTEYAFIKSRKTRSVKIIKTPCLSIFDAKAITTEYVCFLKSDDDLTPKAITILIKKIKSHHPDLIYSDEVMEYGEPHERKKLNFYKPDFSPDMLLAMNYFGNFLCIKTALMQQLVLSKQLKNQNYLYDLVLKAVTKTTHIYHIDEPLYIQSSVKERINYADFFEGFNQEQGRKSLESYCQEKQIKATVLDGDYHGTYRFKTEVEGNPLVSIIIPTRDKPELLKTCIDSILEKTSYQNFEIVGIDNGSIEQETLDLMRCYEDQDARIKFYRYDQPYNYCKINNFAIGKAAGEQLLLLNNDTEVISESWIESLLEYSQRADVGIVGAKLLYPDDTIQHAGVITSYMGHPFRGLKNSEPGYFYSPHVVRNFNAVTFACVMFKRSVYNTIGRLDENIPVAFNDVEYCVRARANGYLNIYTPYACLYHFESKTRKLPVTAQEFVFENKEKAYTIKQNPSFYKRDQYYNKNLTLFSEDYSEHAAGRTSLGCKIEKAMFYLHKIKMLIKKFVPSFLWAYLKKKFKGCSSDGAK